MKDGKQLYRMTYLVRIISYKRGDFVKFNNDFFQIDKISGNKIKLTDLRTWQQKTEDTQNLENAKIIGDQKLIKEMILVSQTEKETQLMNPETYEIRSVIKPEKINLKSDRLKIINIEDQIFILPNNT